jgi:hypothetical protein
MTTAQHVTPIIKSGFTGDLPDAVDAGDFSYGTEPAAIAEDNYRRATFASGSLKHYAKRTGDLDEAPGTAISDLLGDLMHLADCLSLDFISLMDRAYTDYSAEIEGRL